MDTGKYKVGDEVAYGLHGQCVITGIEEKVVAGERLAFYQIRAIKSGPTAAKATQKNSPAILVPIATAENKGLRPIMSKAEAENIMHILESSEYYFELQQPWGIKQKILEETIRKEGAAGLAKVTGHLYILTKRDAVPSSTLMKFYETVERVLMRELSMALNLSLKEVGVLVQKALRNKLAADQ